MTEAILPAFACTGCGKRYRWKPELAGRAVKCPCGTVMTAPADPPSPSPSTPPSASDDLYGFASEPEPKNSRSPVPVSPVPQAAFAPVAGNAVLRYEAKPAGAKEFAPDKLMMQQVPAILVLVGATVEFASAAWRAAPGTIGEAMAEVGIGLMISAALMLVVVYVVSKLRGFKIGPFSTAILRLLAIAVAPGAAMSLLGIGLDLVPIIGWIVNWCIGFCLYFALIGLFFDLDQDDTWYVVIAIFLAKVAVAISMVMFLVWLR